MSFSKIVSTFLAVFSLLSNTQQSQAHLGHLGELAGHSHWVGIGAVVVVGALAAVLGKQTGRDRKSPQDADGEVSEQDAEEAQANT